MSPALKALGVDRMSAAERLALAQEILDTVIADQPLQPLSDVKRRELEERLAAHEADPSDVAAWDQVKQEVLSRFKR
jgi:putative addiction module component (TIGR02574 family)